MGVGVVIGVGVGVVVGVGVGVGVCVVIGVGEGVGVGVTVGIGKIDGVPPSCVAVPSPLKLNLHPERTIKKMKPPKIRRQAVH